MTTIACTACGHIYHPENHTEARSWDTLQDGHTTWCPECDYEMELHVETIITVVL